MRELPILFNTEMVRAILDGRKTVTRRVIKPRYREDEGGFQVCTNVATGQKWVEKMDWDEGSFDNPRYVNPPYSPGDILYVRETWARCSKIDGYYYAYQATDTIIGNWRPSIHMPKEAARISLKVKDVRVERLQEITGGDLLKEGIDLFQSNFVRVAFDEFSALWDSTIKPADLATYGWAADPWVWVIEFERCEKPHGDQEA